MKCIILMNMATMKNIANTNTKTAYVNTRMDMSIPYMNITTKTLLTINATVAAVAAIVMACQRAIAATK